MSDLEIRVVDVYVYRHRPSQPPKFLLLRRAPSLIYAGQWRMVGGKIQGSEAAWQTALREVHEETSQHPQRLWTIPSVNAFYEWQKDRINLIPAFAAELAADPALNHEHDAFAWFTRDEALRHLAWPEQQRLLNLVDDLIRANAILPEWGIALTSP